MVQEQWWASVPTLFESRDDVADKSTLLRVSIDSFSQSSAVPGINCSSMAHLDTVGLDCNEAVHSISFTARYSSSV